MSLSGFLIGIGIGYRYLWKNTLLHATQWQSRDCLGLHLDVCSAHDYMAGLAVLISWLPNSNRHIS